MAKKRQIEKKGYIHSGRALCDLIITVQKASEIKKHKTSTVRLDYSVFMDLPLVYNYVSVDRAEEYLKYIPDMHKFMVGRLKETPHFLNNLLILMQNQNPTWIAAYNYVYQMANDSKSDKEDEIRAKYISALESLFEGIEVRAAGEHPCVGLTERLDKL